MIFLLKKKIILWAGHNLFNFLILALAGCNLIILQSNSHQCRSLPAGRHTTDNKQNSEITPLGHSSYPTRGDTKTGKWLTPQSYAYLLKNPGHGRNTEDSWQAGKMVLGWYCPVSREHGNIVNYILKIYYWNLKRKQLLHYIISFFYIWIFICFEINKIKQMFIMSPIWHIKVKDTGYYAVYSNN